MPRQPARRVPSAAATKEARLAEAGRVAAHFVAARWPELADVTPIVTARHTHTPSSALLARLGLDAATMAERGADDGDEFVFTFMGERGTIDGATTPVVANVTVDTHYRIVKTSVSR
ncbi:MAG: hypothetical protein HGA45_34225 [Chloroflexales bacterium]|nr:hypothetical protein [Chloroflexales bacterium]